MGVLKRPLLSQSPGWVPQTYSLPRSDPRSWIHIDENLKNQPSSSSNLVCESLHHREGLHPPQVADGGVPLRNKDGSRHSPAISQSDAPETRKKMSMSVAGPAWPVRPPRAAARQPRSPAVAAAGYF